MIYEMSVQLLTDVSVFFSFKNLAIGTLFKSLLQEGIQAHVHALPWYCVSTFLCWTTQL